MVHTFNAILLSYWKEHFWISPNEVDEARAYYTKWSKLEREKQVSYAAAAAKLLQLCPTLCDPMDGSPPGSAVPGILQARTLEWVAISFSKVSYTNAYIQNLEKWYWWAYLQSSSGDTDIENRLMDTAGWGEGGMGGRYGQSNMETLPYVKDSHWEFAVWLREHKPGLRNK